MRTLTKDIFVQLSKCGDNATTKMTGVVQIQEIREDGYLMLSDGHCQAEAALFKSLRSRMPELQLAISDIITANMLFHKGKIFVVVEITKLYSGNGHMIGKPIKWDDYRERGCQNPQGTEIIPGFITGEAQSSSSGMNFVRSSMNNADDDEGTPISLLTIGQNDWQIKGRVTKKMPMKNYISKKDNKPGKILNIIITDKSGAVQATFFSEAADQFDARLKEGSTYLFSKGEVKKRGDFNSTSSSVEITFSTRSEIMEVANDAKIPMRTFAFKKISDIERMDVNSRFDLICLVTEVGAAMMIKTKKGMDMKKQPIYVVDDSQMKMEITVFGDQCDTQVPGIKRNDILVFTSLKVTEFNKQKQVGLSYESDIIKTAIDHPKYRDILLWRNKQEKAGGFENSAFKRLGGERAQDEDTKQYTIEQYKLLVGSLQGELQEGDRRSYMMTGTVTLIPTRKKDGQGLSFFYYKCPKSDCYRGAKPDDDNANNCRCPVHGEQSIPAVPKYLGNIRLHDYTDSIFLKMPSERMGSIVFGKPVEEMIDMHKMDEGKFDAYIKTRLGIEYTVKVYPKKETYENESKMAHNILHMFQSSNQSALKSSNALLNSLKCFLNDYKNN